MNCGICDGAIERGLRSEILHHDAAGRPTETENVCRPCFTWAYLTIGHLSEANRRKLLPNVLPFRLPATSADPHAGCSHPPLHA